MDRLSGDGIPDWRHSDWRSDEQEWRQSDKHEEQVPADLRCGLQSYLDQMQVSRGPSGGRLARFWLPIIICLQLVRRQERVQVVRTPPSAWHGASPRDKRSPTGSTRARTSESVFSGFSGLDGAARLSGLTQLWRGPSGGRPAGPRLPIVLCPRQGPLSPRHTRPRVRLAWILLPVDPTQSPPRES